MDHYRILGLKPDATELEIKKAFNKLAKRYHPDKNDSTDAADRFRPIKQAYDYLRQKGDVQSPLQTSSRSHKHHHHSHQNSRSRYRDESFFTGSSARLSEEQKYQDEIARIRHINSQLLEEANLNLKRQSNRARDNRGRTTNKSSFNTEIHPELDDDSYEKIVLDRLRAFSAQER